MPKREKWRNIQETANTAGLISCIGEHIDYAGTMIWPCPIPEEEYYKMKRAGFWITIFFIFAFIILAVCS